MKFGKKSVEDIEVKNKRILMRVDFDVPLNDKGEVIDKQRIFASKRSIDHVRRRGAKSVVLLSHAGSLDGDANEKPSLAGVAECLEELLNKPVTFLGGQVGDSHEAACADPTPGSIFLLENLHFSLEEQGEGIAHHESSTGKPICPKIEDIELFRGRLDALGDVYVNEAFRFSHCKHSSIVGVDLPDMVAGLSFATELAAFARVLAEPVKPLVAIVGGTRSLRKLRLIENLINHVDALIICGDIAFTFLKVCHGVQMWGIEVDKPAAQLAQAVFLKAQERGCEIVFPVDWVCGKVDNMCSIKEDLETLIFTSDQGITEGWSAMDCGPKSIELFVSKIFAARTVLWTGYAGNLNVEHFSRGTQALFDAVVSVNASGGFTLISDDDLHGAAVRWGMQETVSFSRGGDASLHLLEGKSLPGVAVLADKTCTPTWEGTAEGKYAWSDTPKDRTADKDSTSSGTITKYSWADGRRRVSIYIEVEGADDMKEDAFKVVSGKRHVSLVIEPISEKRRTFFLARLWGDIAGAKVSQKKGKQTIVLHLQKVDEASWMQLTAEKVAAGSDDEAS